MPHLILKNTVRINIWKDVSYVEVLQFKFVHIYRISQTLWSSVKFKSVGENGKTLSNQLRRLNASLWVTAYSGSKVKNLPVMRETQGWSLVQEDPLEKEMATHSSILAWRTPWTEEPGGLQSMGSQSFRHNLVTEQLQQRQQHVTLRFGINWIIYWTVFTQITQENIILSKSMLKL